MSLRNFPLYGQLEPSWVFPALWTVSSKNTGRPRMKVAVLDPKLIPDFVDVVIGDFIYELQFAIEESLTGFYQ